MRPKGLNSLLIEAIDESSGVTVLPRRELRLSDIQDVLHPLSIIIGTTSLSIMPFKISKGILGR